MRIVKRATILKLTGLLISIAIGIFLYFRYYTGDQLTVPSHFPEAVTDAELRSAALKWGDVPASKSPNSDSAFTVPDSATDPSHPVRLAIGSLGLEGDSQNGELADLILNDLKGAQGFELIDRQSVERVLQEQQLSLSGLVRAKDAIRVGRLLRADWFLFATTAVANGTNAAVTRLVDARTGVLLNVAVLPYSGGKLPLARSLADFVRESRSNMSHPKRQVYLALGALEDLSLNNRQAHFPNQLRGYLMAACQNTNITVLEREYVEALLQEMRLDMAGLTADSDAGAKPMQSAYWLISGAYQSYENNGFEVELFLDINQIMGRHTSEVTFRGKPGDVLFSEVFRAVVSTINQHTNPVVFSRRTEAANQLMIGKDLLQAGRSMPGNDFHMGLIFTENADKQLSEAQKMLRRHNLKEAITAFQAVLILDPTNRDAKLCWADALRNPTIGQLEQSRDLYREVLEESMDDQWAKDAEFELFQSFDGEGPWDIWPWYASAAARAGSPKAREYFQQKADSERDYARHFEEQPAAVTVTAAALELVKSNVLKNLLDPHYAPSAAMYSLTESFGTNKAAAADASMSILPELEAKFPNRKPSLEAAVLSLQVSTNTPLLGQFEKTLNACVAHPDQFSDPSEFWAELRDPVLPWCIDHDCLGLAETIVAYEQRDHVSNAYYADDEKLILGLEYYDRGRWADALRIFECYSNHPMQVQSSFRTNDRWSLFDGILLPGWYVADCEKRLGRQAPHDPREFEMDSPVLDLGRNSVFATDAAGLWIAGSGQLRHFNFHLDTDFQVALPINGATPINCISIDESCVWLGTAGAGLLQIRKTNHECRSFNVADGLLMDAITRLASDRQSLWIGYGDKTSGGFGRFDLASLRIASFTPAFDTHGHGTTLLVDPLNGPPRHPVVDLAIQPDGNVLALASDKGLQRYSVADNSWETLPSQHRFTISAVAANDAYLAQGIDIVQLELELFSKAANQQETNLSAVSEDQLASAMSAYATTHSGQPNQIGPHRGRLLDHGGIEVCALASGTWKTLREVEGIPGPPKILLLHGDELWAAGAAFLACVDLNDFMVKKYCYVPGVVRGLQTGGGCVWVQFGGHLYRSPVSSLQ